MKFKKFIAAILVITITLISSVTNIFADQQAPQISEWALSTLNEGEKYGIFPINWYYDGTFQQPITEERLQIILDNTSKKLELLNISQKSNFVPKTVENKSTKQSVITLLYNEIAKYELPQGLEIDKYEPVEYMVKRGISSDSDLNSPFTLEQTAVLSTKLIEDIYKEANAGSKGFAWKVTNKDNTMYFLGSIHIGTTDLYPINYKLKEAFNESDELLVEVDVLQPKGIQEFIQIATYTDGTTIQDHVSPEIYDKILKVCEKLNLPIEQYNKIKPWYLTNNLNVIISSGSENMEDASLAANLGLDLYFITSAYSINKPIVELESYSSQAKIFDGLSDETQQQNLNDIMDIILSDDKSVTDISSEIILNWQTMWQQGNIDSFKEDYTKALGEEESEFNMMLLGERDKNMAVKLSEMLERDGQNTYFVVVGAAHLVVDNMVIDQLKEKGYNVQILNVD